MTIYLYVKRHNATGLRYLGKTTAKDPYRYKGSGVEWQNILSYMERISQPKYFSQQNLKPS